MWWLRILTYVGAGGTFLLALAVTTRRYSMALADDMFHVCQHRSEWSGSFL